MGRELGELVGAGRGRVGHDRATQGRAGQGVGVRGRAGWGRGGRGRAWSQPHALPAKRQISITAY